jgi:hypothetical protein
VGQGLFYSGLIQRSAGRNFRQFSFVYDCGSTSSHRFLRREANDFKELLPCWRNGKKRLDLLVVSHLHDDHVNGLEYLLKDTEVDTVVMPYTEQLIRLMAWIESAGQEVFLRDFYADPAGWFSERGVHRIILIGGPKEDNYLGNDDLPESKDQDWRGIERIWIRKRDIRSRKYEKGTEILSLDSSPVMRWHSDWWFRFSNLELPSAEAYRKAAEKYMRDKKCSLTDIFSSSKMTRDFAQKIKAVLDNGKTINRTSLVTVHEPVEHYKYSFFRASDLRCSDEFQDMEMSGQICLNLNCLSTRCRRTVLMGDIEISDEDEMKELAIDSFQGGQVVQYPHHGERRSLSEKLERKILTEESVTIFSAGIINRYGHPDPDVANRQILPIFVNERNAFDYFISVR